MGTAGQSVVCNEVDVEEKAIVRYPKPYTMVTNIGVTTVNWSTTNNNAASVKQDVIFSIL